MVPIDEKPQFYILYLCFSCCIFDKCHEAADLVAGFMPCYSSLHAVLLPLLLCVRASCMTNKPLYKYLWTLRLPLLPLNPCLHCFMLPPFSGLTLACLNEWNALFDETAVRISNYIKLMALSICMEAV